MKPNIVFLDAYSLGKADLSAIRALGNYTEYEYTRRDQIIGAAAKRRWPSRTRWSSTARPSEQLPRLRLISWPQRA